MTDLRIEYGKLLETLEAFVRDYPHIQMPTGFREKGSVITTADVNELIGFYNDEIAPHLTTEEEADALIDVTAVPEQLSEAKEYGMDLAQERLEELIPGFHGKAAGAFPADVFDFTDTIDSNSRHLDSLEPGTEEYEEFEERITEQADKAYEFYFVDDDRVLDYTILWGGTYWQQFNRDSKFMFYPLLRLYLLDHGEYTLRAPPAGCLSPGLPPDAFPGFDFTGKVVKYTDSLNDFCRYETFVYESESETKASSWGEYEEIGHYFNGNPGDGFRVSFTGGVWSGGHRLKTTVTLFNVSDYTLTMYAVYYNDLGIDGSGSGHMLYYPFRNVGGTRKLRIPPHGTLALSPSDFWGDCERFEALAPKYCNYMDNEGFYDRYGVDLLIDVAYYTLKK